MSVSESSELLDNYFFSSVLIIGRPLAMITPAKSHPEVIVQAISARDRTRAEKFAKRHGVPEVKDSYQS